MLISPLDTTMIRCRAGLQLIKQRASAATLPLRTSCTRHTKDIKAATACPRGCLKKVQSRISAATNRITRGPKQRCERWCYGAKERYNRQKHRLTLSTEGQRNSLHKLKTRVHEVTAAPRESYKKLHEDIEEAPGRCKRNWNYLQRKLEKGLECTQRSYSKPKIQNNDHLKCLFRVRLLTVRAIRSMDEVLTGWIILHNRLLSLTILSHRYKWVFNVSH